MPDYLLRNATQENPVQSGSPVRPHHDEIDIRLARIGSNLFVGRAVPDDGLNLHIGFRPQLGDGCQCFLTGILKKLLDGDPLSLGNCSRRRCIHHIQRVDPSTGDSREINGMFDRPCRCRAAVRRNQDVIVPIVHHAGASRPAVRTVAPPYSKRLSVAKLLLVVCASLSKSVCKTGRAHVWIIQTLKMPVLVILGMPDVSLEAETVDRLDELRIDDETYDEIINELINIYEATEMSLAFSGDEYV